MAHFPPLVWSPSPAALGGSFWTLIPMTGVDRESQRGQCAHALFQLMVGAGQTSLPALNPRGEEEEALLNISSLDGSFPN